MGKDLAETIVNITRDHLTRNNGLLLGQALSAVGFVNNTIPSDITKNIIELPMTDTAGSYIAVGAALAGRRPILVIRFQDFLWLNASGLVNYAAKTKELSGKGTPIFVRALIQEGKGTGALHSGCFHNLFMNMPGMKVVAPMTPKEYRAIWESFMSDDVPYLCSEHRSCFKNKDETYNIIDKNADITLFGIGGPRLYLEDAAWILKKDYGILANIVHILWLKPLQIPLQAIMTLKRGIVVDTGYEICGASESVAYHLMGATGKRVKALGRYDKTICVNPGNENLSPSAERIAEVAENEVKKCSTF